MIHQFVITLTTPEVGESKKTIKGIRAAHCELTKDIYSTYSLLVFQGLPVKSYRIPTIAELTRIAKNGGEQEYIIDIYKSEWKVIYKIQSIPAEQ